MDTLLRDIRHGLRNLARTPGFTAIAILTLALGIGANTTIFSVISGTLLKPIPFPRPERVMLVLETFGKGPNNWNILSAPNFHDFEHLSHSFERMALFDAGRGYSLGASGNQQEAERVPGHRVSAGFFDVLGVQPFLGRGFRPEEEILGNHHEVILSYRLWKNRFAGDPALVGKTVPIDGAGYTVIGVMPRGFEWQFWSDSQQLWVPVGYTKTDYSRGENSFLAIGRLKPGVTEDRARAEMEAVGRAVRQQNPVEDADMGATILRLDSFGLDGLQSTMVILLAAVTFVLLIACVNVANLLLARGAARRREFAIRRALGAAGGRIARQLLTESLILAILGGGAGLLLASLSTRLMFVTMRLDQMHLPLRPVESLSIDARVFLFALAVSCVTGILFGLAPAWRAVRGDVNDPLKEGARGATARGHFLRHALVASEVALAVIVLCGAGLMIKSMSRLLDVDPGFKPANLLTMSMTVPQEAIYVGPPSLPRFCQDLVDHVGAIPGVLSVSAASDLPMRGISSRSFQIEGRALAEPGKMPGADYNVACPDYFKTMGVPVVQGREFTVQDSRTAQQVIVINQSMANRFWPNQDPLGQAIRLAGSNGPRLTVVGVVADIRNRGLDSATRRQFFRPYQQAGWPYMNILVRANRAPLSFTASIKKALADVMPDRPVSGVTTIEQVVHDSTGSRRFPMLMLSAFSVLALVLAAVGIVGVVGHSVTQRTHEIGIRMALGASARNVLGLMLSANMAWVAGGLGAGIAGAAALTRLLTNLLYQVRPLDPWVLGAVSLVLALVALFASYLPASRAAKIDPMVALRWE